MKRKWKREISRAISSTLSFTRCKHEWFYLSAVWRNRNKSNRDCLLESRSAVAIITRRFSNGIEYSRGLLWNCRRAILPSDDAKALCKCETILQQCPSRSSTETLRRVINIYRCMVRNVWSTITSSAYFPEKDSTQLKTRGRGAAGEVMRSTANCPD